MITNVQNVSSDVLIHVKTNCEVFIATFVRHNDSTPIGRMHQLHHCTTHPNLQDLQMIASTPSEL